MRARVDKKERPIARSAQVRRSRGARAPPRADAATSRPEHGSAAPVVARARAAGAGRAPACRATRARPPPGAERTVAVAGLHDPLRRFARDRVERLLVRRGRRGGRGRRRERGLDAPRAPATRSPGRRPSAGAAPRRRRGRRAPRPRGAHALRVLCRPAPATIPWRITGGTPLNLRPRGRDLPAICRAVR
jgi:hypothetical protein